MPLTSGRPNYLQKEGRQKKRGWMVCCYSLKPEIFSMSVLFMSLWTGSCKLMFLHTHHIIHIRTVNYALNMDIS